MDRIEIWQWGNESLYQEAVVIENGKAKVPENVMAMLMQKAGYKKVQTHNYE